MKNFALPLLLTFFVACKQESKQSTTDVESKMLERMYVKNKSGAVLLDKPSEKGRVIDSVAFGAYFYDIYHENDTYYRIIKDQVPLFIEKNDLALPNQIMLDNEDLNKIHLYVKDTIRQKFNKPQIQNLGLTIGFTDEYNYKKAASEKVNFLIDSLDIPKKNGIITMRFPQGVVQLKDEFSDKEVKQMYHYRGYIPYLNAIIIEAFRDNKTAYIYFDKATINNSEYEGFVYLSPSKDKAIMVYSNPQEDYSLVSLYDVNSDKKLKLVSKIFYSYWFSTNALEDMFWSQDNLFYIKIKNKFNYWDSNSLQDEGYQYITLSIDSL